LKTKKVAYNLSQDAKNHYLASRGMKKGDKLWNLNSAAEWCIEQDMEMRRQQREVHGNNSRIATSDKYTGCLRAHTYRHDHGNRGTTEFHVILFSARSVVIHNIAAKSKRCVWHIDGSQCDVEHSAVVKQNDVVQRWLCWLSNQWVQQSHSKADWNNVVRRNFPPKLLTEWHSPQCATKDLSMWLKQFFDAQDLLCSEKHRPLVVKSDCAKGLCAVVMNSLAFEGKTPITRVVYNNLMLVVLGYAESQGWEKAIVSSVMDRVLGLIPAFHHLCRPHIIRAVRMYVISKERPTRINALSTHHEALLLSLFRHGTCTSTLCEYLVGLALVCYYLTCPTIAAKLTVLRSPSCDGWPPEVDVLMKDVGHWATSPNVCRAASDDSAAKVPRRLRDYQR
jgi:hypothetical protein